MNEDIVLSTRLIDNCEATVYEHEDEKYGIIFLEFVNDSLPFVFMYSIYF